MGAKKKFYYPMMLQSNMEMIRHTLIHASFSDIEYPHVKRESLFENVFLNLARQDRLEQQWSFGRNQEAHLQ